MPSEFRFDDLDLREEPAKGDVGDSSFLSGLTHACTKTAACTNYCCTETSCLVNGRNGLG